MEDLHEKLMKVDERGAKDWKYWVGLHLTQFNRLIAEIEHAVSSAAIAMDSAERSGEAVDVEFDDQVKKLSNLQKEAGDLYSVIHRKAMDLGIEIEESN